MVTYLSYHMTTRLTVVYKNYILESTPQNNLHI